MARRFTWNNLIFIAMSSASATALGGLVSGIFGFEALGMITLVAASVLSTGVFYLVASRSCTSVVGEVIDQVEGIIQNDAQVNEIASERLLDLHDQISRMHARSREEVASRQVAISRSEEILAVLSMLEGPVVVFDRMGTIRLTNDASDSLFGCAASQWF